MSHLSIEAQEIKLTVPKFRKLANDEILEITRLRERGNDLYRFEYQCVVFNNM